MVEKDDTFPLDIAVKLRAVVTDEKSKSEQDFCYKQANVSKIYNGWVDMSMKKIDCPESNLLLLSCLILMDAEVLQGNW